MPSRPAITVLLFTRSQVHRADFASAARAPVIVERERSDAPDLASAIETALAEGPAPGKRTYILSTDFWLQTASLPSSRAAGLSEADIAAGLNFEAEVLSGLPALDSAPAITSLPSAGGERRFLLLQIPFGIRDGIERVLTERGSRLAGLAHPAALPRNWGKTSLTLQRLELWPDLAVGLRPSGTVFDAQVSNADPSTGRWLTDLSEWAGADVLVGPGVATPEGVNATELSSSPSLADWFRGWVQELTSPGCRAAVVTPPVKPTPAGVRFAFASLLALAVGGLAYFHWMATIKQPITDARERTASAKEATKRLADLTAKEAEEKKRADGFQQEAARFNDLADRVEAHQIRYSRLLVALAAQKPTDVMIRTIEATSGEPKVLGTALRPELADDFARSLSPSIRALGWDVQPPRKTAMKLTADGGPWSFEMEFQRLPESPPPDGKSPRAEPSPGPKTPVNSGTPIPPARQD